MSPAFEGPGDGAAKAMLSLRAHDLSRGPLRDHVSRIMVSRAMLGSLREKTCARPTRTRRLSEVPSHQTKQEVGTVPLQTRYPKSERLPSAAVPPGLFVHHVALVLTYSKAGSTSVHHWGARLRVPLTGRVQLWRCLHPPSSALGLMGQEEVHRCLRALAASTVSSGRSRRARTPSSRRCHFSCAAGSRTRVDGQSGMGKGMEWWLRGGSA